MLDYFVFDGFCPSQQIFSHVRTFFCLPASELNQYLGDRVKSGKFGRSAKFGQRLCLFHVLIIGIKNKLTKQTVKILMRRLIWISIVCKCMSEVTRLFPNEVACPRTQHRTSGESGTIGTFLPKV